MKLSYLITFCMWAVLTVILVFPLFGMAGEVFVFERPDGVDFYDSDGTITHIYERVDGVQIISEDADTPNINIIQDSDGETRYIYTPHDLIWSDE